MEVNILWPKVKSHSLFEYTTRPTLDYYLFLIIFIHLWGTGILAKAQEYGFGDGLSHALSRPDDFVNEGGKGIYCTIEGHRVHIGNRRSLESNSIDIRSGTFDAMEYLESKGQTAVVVSVDGQTEAVIGLIDKAKDEASTTVNVLRTVLGIDVYMLTGDNV